MNTETIEKERRRIASWGAVNPRRLKAVLAHAGRRVLDVGCASGEYVSLLRRQGYDAHGIDILPSAAWAGADRERFRVGDAARLPYADGEFDTVLLFEVLEHVPDPAAVLAEVRRVCRENLILSVPDARLDPSFAEAGLAFHHWVDRSHIQFFGADDLRALLERCGFVVLSLEGINPIRPELLFFSSFAIPSGLARFLARACARLPFRRHRFMTLLAVAERDDR